MRAVVSGLALVNLLITTACDFSNLLCCSQVTSVALELGSRGSRCAVLVWSGWGAEAAATNNSFVSYGLKSASKEDQIDWDDLKVVPKIKYV